MAEGLPDQNPMPSGHVERSSVGEREAGCFSGPEPFLEPFPLDTCGFCARGWRLLEGCQGAGNRAPSPLGDPEEIVTRPESERRRYHSWQSVS